MLAIVIPYFKLAFFEATLQSLALQTDKRFKVYIGDDASPEDPTKLLNKYQGKFDFVYNRFENNLGSVSLTKQWERCVSLIDKEEWVMIMGDDDTLGGNCVTCFYSHLAEVEQQKINVVRYATIVIDQNDKEISILHTHPKYEKAVDFLMRKLKGGTRSSLSEFIFKKKVLLDVRFKDLPLAWHSDVLAILEFSNFELIYTINKTVVYVRSSGINISSRNDNLKLKNIATFNFYLYLIKKRRKKFNVEQMETLYFNLEKSFLDNKKNKHYWFQLTKLNFFRLDFKRYFEFLLKFYKLLLKKYIK